MSKDERAGATERARERTAVHRAAIVYFAVLFAATMWPIYALFAGIRPMILGLPLSLFYQVVLVALAFSALLALYVWEGRRFRDGP